MKFLLISSLLLIFPGLICAQVLRANVELSSDHLPPVEQQYLDNYKNQIEDYFNNYSWTDDEYETDIEISINIIIETVTEKSFERIYKAQFLIKSISGESFYDKEWEFPYQPGYLFEHQSVQFDPLCNFLDYYAYLILAGELDTYGTTLGTAFYDAALDIANRGILSEYPRGWNNRLAELLKITNVRTRPLREAKPDFFEAIYLYEEGQTKEARKLALKVLDAIEKVVREQPNNKYLRMFFDAHYNTFAKIFNNDETALTRLIDYDNKHRETYREAM
jgi:hypothetical protein